MSSAVAVLRRSACYALRRPRPSFPRAVIETQPPPRAHNFSTRGFHGSDCTVVGSNKPPETNKATTVEDGISLSKLDEVSRAFETYHAGVREYVEQVKRERRTKLLLRRTRTIFFAGVLATIHVKRRFFSGTTTEDKEMSTGNN